MLDLIVIFVCFSLSAILSCAEIAFVAVSPPVLREMAKQGNARAKLLLQMREKPERILSITQIGISFLALLAGAFGSSGAIAVLVPWMQSAFGLSDTLASAFSNIAVVLPLTYLNVVLAELVPKTLAMQHTDFFALATAKPLFFMSKLIRPLVFLFEKSTRGVMYCIAKIFSFGSKTESGSEVVEIGGLHEKSKMYISNIFDIEHKPLRAICIPWDKVVFLRESFSERDVEKVALTSGHTRLPVLSGASIRGVLHTKEFFAVKKEETREAWTRLIREPMVFDANTSLMHAFLTLQNDRSHMGIVTSNGALYGLVTLEDILEQIVGEIHDEDDVAP